MPDTGCRFACLPVCQLSRDSGSHVFRQQGPCIETLDNTLYYDARYRLPVCLSAGLPAFRDSGSHVFRQQSPCIETLDNILYNARYCLPNCTLAGLLAFRDSGNLAVRQPGNCLIDNYVYMIL